MLDIAELIVFMGLVVFVAHSCLFQSIKFTSANPWGAVLLALPILVTAVVLMYSVNKVSYRNLIVASMLAHCSLPPYLEAILRTLRRMNFIKTSQEFICLRHVKAISTFYVL